MGNILWGGWRPRDGSGFAFSSSPACSAHKQLIPGRAELAAYLAGAVPGRGRDEGTAPHLARAENIARIFAEKSAAPP